MAAFVVPKGILIGVTGVIILAAVAASALVFLPTARVVVTPTRHEKSAEQTILLSATATEPDFRKFILPARVIEAHVEVSQTVTRAGGSPRPGYAKGTVRLINSQDEEQPLLPKTNLRHEATKVFFLTDRAVRIPPKGEIAVPVTAKEEGASGNVPAGKFIVDKLPPDLQPKVWGESKTAMAGGEVFDTPLPLAEVTAAQDKAVEEARTQARGQLTAEAGGASIRDDLISEAVEERAASVEPGSLASSYTVSARVRLRTFVVDDTAVLSLTLLALQTLNEPNEEFVSYEPDSFSLQFQRADFERGEARVMGHLTGVFSEKIESKIFEAEALAGRAPAEVQEYFRQFPSVEQVEVTLSPFWVRTVPSRGEAVEVVVKKK